MKKSTLLFFFLCFSASLLAQDIIITKDNVRIEAKVLMEYEAVIKYSLFNTLTDSTYLIPKAKINTITYENGKVVSYEDIDFRAPNVTNNNKTTKKTEKNFRIGAQFGYGYRFERGFNEHWRDYHGMKQYLFNLKNGVSFGADLTYYFGKYMGAGIKYNGIYSQAKLPKKIFSDTPYDWFVFRTSEKVNIHYIGVFYAVRYFIIPHKHCIFLNAGVGYIGYRNKVNNMVKNFNSFETISETLTENTLAFSAEIGHDFLVTKSLAIGLQVSTVIDLLNDNINGSHLDITFGLRFWK
jgi:hypothetical protein